MSITVFARTTPVVPPRVNIAINPYTQRVGREARAVLPNILAFHLYSLIPVGRAIPTVAAIKYARVSRSSPTVNI